MIFGLACCNEKGMVREEREEAFTYEGRVWKEKMDG
jgi:hypothetical protein